MEKRWCFLWRLFFCCWLLPSHVWGGGSGLNVVVVVNQKSTNSMQLGNYYCEKRQVPPQNFLRINWPGGNIAWTNSDYNTYLLTPLLSMLSTRQLTNQIDYVVLSMDIPYRLLISNGDVDSTTSALFYGFKTNTSAPPGYPPSCSLPPSSSNSYVGSESLFRAMPPGNLSYTNVLAIMLTESNLATAKMVVDQAVLGDSSFPTQTVFLAKSTDTGRNIRYPLFDNAIFNTRLRGNYSMQRTNVYNPSELVYIFGYENGVQSFGTGATTFAPGAMADNLTSFGGRIFEDTQQTPALIFLNAGASGTYGTVDEPCTHLEKFPSPQNYFYQARGFSLAECYYQSVTNPYQGLVLGEPLSAPFQLPASGAWINPPSGTTPVLAGTTNLSVQFNASDSTHPVQQVDLFVDGLFSQTLTNIPPRTNNTLYVTINGFPTNYTVPASATLKSIASNLTSRLNTSSYSNLTKVTAYAHGDRIELQSMDRSKAGGQVSLSTSNSIGTGTALTSWITSSGSSFLDTAATGIRSFEILGSALPTSFLQMVVTRTNGTQVSLGVTNDSTLSLPDMAQRLIDLINTNTSPGLQGPDGLTAGDFDMATGVDVGFNVLANSTGWNAAQIQADLNGSASFTITPSGNVALDENIHDLQPRAHLYITAGVTNLPLTFPLNSANLADGYHELTTVAYEGSHVRTQKRIAQTVRIQNSSLSATFTTLFGGSNTVVGATLQFSVVANTNNISKIELFSTGGSLTNITGQSNVIFSIPGTNLDVGLHPFYAIITATNGKQYRTETKWIRLVGGEAPFALSITVPPPTLSWPATAGRRYDVLSTTNLSNAFQLRDSITLTTSSVAKWIETNATPLRQFYRVRTTN